MTSEHEIAVHLLANLLKTTFATEGDHPNWVDQADQAAGVTSQMLEALAAQAKDPDIAALINYINHAKP